MIHEDRCIKSVWTSFHSHQCHNKRTIGDYCKTHDPATVKAKQLARFKKWDDARDARQAEWTRKARLDKEYPLIAAQFIAYLEDDGLKTLADDIRERIK